MAHLLSSTQTLGGFLMVLAVMRQFLAVVCFVAQHSTVSVWLTRDA